MIKSRANLMPLETILKFNENFPVDFELTDLNLFFQDITLYLNQSEILGYLIDLFYPWMGEKKTSNIMNSGWDFPNTKNFSVKDYQIKARYKTINIFKDKCYRCAKLYKYVDLNRIILENSLILNSDQNRDLTIYFTNLKLGSKNEGMKDQFFIETFIKRFPNIEVQILQINNYLKNCGIQAHLGQKLDSNKPKKGKKISDKKKSNNQLSLF